MKKRKAHQHRWLEQSATLGSRVYEACYVKGCRARRPVSADQQPGAPIEMTPEAFISAVMGLYNEHASCNSPSGTQGGCEIITELGELIQQYSAPQKSQEGRPK